MKKSHCLNILSFIFKACQLIHTPFSLILVYTIKSAIEPASFTIHIRVKHNKWKHSFIIIINKINKEITHSVNISVTFSKYTIFSLSKYISKLILITKCTKLTVVVTKAQCIWDFKSVHKCCKNSCLSSIIYSSRLGKKRKYRIACKND